MRGAVAIALTLSLGDQAGPSFSHPRSIVHGMVLFSITVQG
jgi:NhaP-type Na+/H+ or K+/H+ antiporter